MDNRPGSCGSSAGALALAFNILVFAGVYSRLHCRSSFLGKGLHSGTT